LRLADERAERHPEDGAPIYWKRAELLMATSGGSYDDVVELLVKAAAARKRMGPSAQF
jgi:hypothetical protein